MTSIAFGLPFGTRGSGPAAPPKVTGLRQQALGMARTRLMTGMLLFIVAIVLLGLRLADLALMHDRPVLGAVSFALQAPPRADIIDRNTVELARTFDAYAVSVAPRKLVGDPRILARQIAAILPDRSAEAIYAELTHPGAFRYISPRVLPEQAKRINDLGEPAITLEREPERLYPNLNLAAHVLGYTEEGKHKIAAGKVGLERSFNARLIDPQLRGTPVQLALDARVQQALQSELSAVMLDQRADGAAGVVLDVATGEVIALASLPDFNPNAPSRATDDGRYNKVTYGVYELGSTFKALTIAMALDSGVINDMGQKFDATAPLHIAGYTIHDDHALNRWLTIPDIFIHSSNIGTARIASALGRDRQHAYLEKLGFFKPVAVELPERATPQFPPLSNWGELATMTIGYGHGLAVSPLHLATAYAALVNGGTLRPATLLKVAPGQAVPGVRVFSQETSDRMRALLRLVVTDGTGRKADAVGYRVGGKTGTAEKPSRGGYIKGANVSTFAAAFPMDAPRYVVVATVDNPKGSKASYGFKTAGMVVAPTVGHIIARIGPTLGVTPDTSRDIDVQGLLSQLQGKPVE